LSPSSSLPLSAITNPPCSAVFFYGTDNKHLTSYSLCPKDALMAQYINYHVSIISVFH